MKNSNPKRYTILICLVLALATLLAYEPIRHNDFVNYDDDQYITENPHVTGGLTWNSVVWAFTTPYISHWHPLTWLSHMLDYQLFGLNPLGHHLTSLLFHLANTLLLFGVLKSMTRSIWPSALVAAAFALHPLHVESVAWASERKDVLSTFFWLLTMAAYVRYARKPSIGKYVLVILIFALGLMSKPMLVTLPFVLLLLDFWPLGRLRSCDSDFAQTPIARLIIEKIPLFAMVVGSCIVTYLAMQSWGNVAPTEFLSVTARIANVLVCYVDYLTRMVYPRDLAVLYPLVTQHSLLEVTLCVLVLTAISAVVVCLSRRQGYLALGWLWYLGTLVPVIGLVQVGYQSTADRYTYVPLIGIFIMIVWGGAEIMARWQIRKNVIAIMMSVIIIAMAAGTRRQVRYWRDNMSLFEHTLAVTHNNYMICNNLGFAYGELGQHEKAKDAFKEAIGINPDYAKAHNNLGFAYSNLQRYQEAINAFKEAIRIRGNYSEAHYNLGMAYGKLERYPEAIDVFKKGIGIKSDYPEIHYYLGIAYGTVERYSEAINAFKEAIGIKSDHLYAHYNLGIVYLELGDKVSAMDQYKILKELDEALANELLVLINK